MTECERLSPSLRNGTTITNVTENESFNFTLFRHPHVFRLQTSGFSPICAPEK